MASFISMFGGAEVRVVSELELKVNAVIEKVSELEKVVDKLDKYTMNMEAGLREHLVEDEESTQQRLHNVESAVNSLSLKTEKINTTYSKDAVQKRIDDLERMQRYFQTSHGKVLNDISDLKKELYNLYERQTPPPQEVLDKSVAKEDDEIMLTDICNQMFTNYHERGPVLRAITENELKTVADLKKVPYFQLSTLKCVGPKVLAALQCIYEQYSDTDPKVSQNPDDLHDAIFMQQCSMRSKCRAYNTLKKEGINTISDLTKKPYAYYVDKSGFGKHELAILKTIYNKYIY